MTISEVFGMIIRGSRESRESEKRMTLSFKCENNWMWLDEGSITILYVRDSL